MTDPFAPLIAALDRRAQTGRTARFWLRDDDAIDPTPALDQLLHLTAAHGIPCLLAVIPQPTGPALARRLDGERQVAVALHGWSHQNHAAAGEKKCELGRHRPVATVLAELAQGLGRLSDLHGPRLTPILVPPWNRIDDGLIPALPGLGLLALSVFGPARPGLPPRLNTHVDIIDWHGNGGGRPPLDLVRELVAASGSGISPIGLLTHHLVHDAAAWAFLDGLFAKTAQHPGCRWNAAPDLLAEMRSKSA